jgi:TetR/AcrR family transcriptional repressor of mexJK operon
MRDGAQLELKRVLQEQEMVVRRRGRPRRRDTRDVLLSVARRLFLAVGFEGTSMDSVVAMARISKATAYSHFRSKEELYRAAMQTHPPAFFGPLLAPNGSIEETLLGFGRRFLREVLSPAHVAKLRALAHDRSRFPDLATDLFAKAYGEPLRQLERYLETVERSGRLNAPSTRAAAQHLVGLLLGLAQVSVLLSEEEPISVDVDERAREAIAAFWRAYGASPWATETIIPACATPVSLIPSLGSTGIATRSLCSP